MSGGFDWFAVATACAAIAGPAIAVWVTRHSDDRKDIRSRRMEIFRTLMRTRRMPVHYDHVGALNLIEIEFHDKENVLRAWKAYFEALGERVAPDANDEVHQGIAKKRDQLLTKLIYEISKVLGFKVEQLDILEGNYLPQAWNDEELEQRMVRKALIDVLGGKRPVLVQPYAPGQAAGPYPPAPKIQGTED